MNIVEFKQELNSRWQNQVMVAITLGAADVVYAIAKTINNAIMDNVAPLTKEQAWKLVFSREVTFLKRATEGDNCWADCVSHNHINFYSNFDISFSNRGPEIASRLAVHELGHAFGKAIEDNGFERPRDELANQHSSLIVRKDHSYDCSEDGFADCHYKWQFGIKTNATEIFADMFLGWVYNRWALNKNKDGFNELGQKRADFMNSNMLKYISRASTTEREIELLNKPILDAYRQV